MTIVWHRQRGPRRLAVSLLVWGGLGVLAWLDRDLDGLATHAAIFGWILSALSWLAAALGAAGGVIATSLVAAVGYVANALAWLTVRVGHILANSGSMFARVWDSAQRFYKDVLRPALVWLHTFYQQARAWLERVFKPVFTFLLRVRDELRRIYTRFVQPILDIIDVARVGLRVLTRLGVEWARTLDTVLTRVESAITDNFLKLLGRLNHLIDVVDSVVTPGRLFQRLPFVRSLERDAGYWIRVFWNRQVVGLSTPDIARRRAKEYERADPTVLGRELGAFYRGSGGELDGIIGELVPTWQAAAGQRPYLRGAP